MTCVDSAFDGPSSTHRPCRSCPSARRHRTASYLHCSRSGLHPVYTNAACSLVQERHHVPRAAPIDRAPRPRELPCAVLRARHLSTAIVEGAAAASGIAPIHNDSNLR